MPSSPADLDLAFAALGDPVRRALVTRLARGDATVGELAEPFHLTPQAISHHVGVLRRCGLVEQRREGTRRPCRLRADQLALLGAWIDERRRSWNDRLDSLAQHLTADPSSAADPPSARPAADPSSARPALPRRNP